jgi:multidrug resistance efflux pump
MSEESTSAPTAKALPVPLERQKARTFRISRRFWKLGIAGGVACAGVLAVLSESEYVATSNAVVSTYVLSVRTPIEGTVTGLPLASGISVKNMETLAQVENPLVDPQMLINLETLQSTAQSTADALASEQGALSRQRRDLISRSEDYSVAMCDRLNRDVIQAERELAARRLALEEASLEADRSEKLHKLQITSDTDYQKALSTKRIAEQELAAQQAVVESIRSQAKSASRGLLAEPGASSDVPYSRQRADEVTLRMADNERILLTFQAQAEQAHATMTEQTDWVNLMRHSDIRSPINGTVWKIDTVNGEHTAAGDTLLSLVDCRRQFVLAVIPQNRMADVAIHGTARFRLIGEPNERTGTVLSVSGDAVKDENLKLAATPTRNPDKAQAMVLISIDPNSSVSGNEEDECLVGRNARVLIPTVATNAVFRLLHAGF